MENLKEYNEKRDFGRTPEPKGKVARRKGDELSFVIQKHAARRLHYDFRLELDGVLKSWAVPKGPSLVPGDKRLAAQTEDHPLDYAEFEGVIPRGEYGAGSVIVWDRGTWTPIGDPHEGLAKGNLEFRLEGEKLRGRFRLVKLRNTRDKKPSWLLMKGKDEDARSSGPAIVDERPESVVSGRSLKEVADAPDDVWHSNRTSKPKRAVAVERLTGARAAPLPKVPAAQLATLVDAPPPGPDWIHEIKLDGYRILARIEDGKVSLWTRNGNDWSDRFAQLLPALAALPCRTAVLDGEVVVLDEKGRSSFQRLQEALGQPRPDFHYFLFDVTYLDGQDLSGVPLIERKSVLTRLLGRTSGILRYSDHVEGEGEEFFAKACKLGVEGIVSKQRDAPYTPVRSRTWVKVKCVQRQEFVIVGFTDPSGSRKGLGALLLGVHDSEGKLVYAGKVGTGFSQKVLLSLRARLERIERKEATVAAPRDVQGEAHWVAPELVAECSFTEWTRDGQIRHPVFQGLREDKPPAQIVPETPKQSAAVVSPRPPAGVKITHPDKVLYPDSGITKKELISYYTAIGDLILPGIRNRPLTLVRCPQGAGEKCFYQKHASDTVPRAIPRVTVRKGEAPYLMVDGLPALLTLVQLGVLEFHVWGATADALDKPDLIVFDLDPDPSVGWPKVVETAHRLEDRLEALGLRGFPRVTGGKGLHIVVPIRPKATFDEVREFAQTMARNLVRDYPNELTAIMTKSRRKGKIFIDYLRNARDATAIASYSTRRHPGAPVAMPLRWGELSEPVEKPPVFPMREALPLALQEGDRWPELEDARTPLTEALLKRISKQ